jgi:glyoxylase-like metal-dependent hydrolase (beta-lactamase superfamily II)/rhodanese-related sulfurtransferase
MGSDFEIGITEFKARLDRGEVPFILDLRNEDEFASWRIEGRGGVEMVNISQLDFVGEEDKYLDRLPTGKEITIVCAHGGASKYSAEVLHEKGFKAVGLAGGMDAWSVLYETGQVSDAPLIFQIYRIAKGCMTHVLISDGEAVVIDAVRHLEHIRPLLDRYGARLKYVFDTHLQADHVSGGRELAASAGVNYLINPVDATGADYEFTRLEDGAEFKFGSSCLTALHSPGHTPGSTSFLLEDRFLFPGDIIMETTVGRPDLGGMVEVWGELLHHTIHQKFKSLADDIMILPTHAASVKERDKEGIVRFSMASARKTLALFGLRDQQAFISHIKGTLLENPDRYQDIRRVNLGLLEPDEERVRELEIGKNLCGMAGKND